MRIGRLGQLFAPGYGACFQCKTPWKFVNGHITDYHPNLGCFPLCDRCWSELSPLDRLPFYRQLIDMWYTQDPIVYKLTHDETWELVQTAVLEGK